MRKNAPECIILIKYIKHFPGRGIVNLLSKISSRDLPPCPVPAHFKTWIRLWVCPPGLPSLKSGCPLGTVDWLRASLALRLIVMMLLLLLLLQLLQNIVEMVGECKSSVKSLRQQCQLTALRSADSQTDVNQRTGLLCFSTTRAGAWTRGIISVLTVCLSVRR